MDNIVAVGTMYESPSQNATIHGVPLGVENVRVVVDMVIGDDCALPIPVNDELQTLHQAVGNFVGWPRRLVITVDDKEVCLFSIEIIFLKEI